MKNDNSYTYTYSAPEQEEVRRIRSKYDEKKEEVTKIDLLRKLDKSVTQTSTVAALTVGIIGTLIMGFGMSLVMVWNVFIPGCIIGIAGMVTALLAYPLYIKITDIKRKKLAPQILNLADELLEK